MDTRDGLRLCARVRHVWCLPGHQRRIQPAEEGPAPRAGAELAAGGRLERGARGPEPTERGALRAYRLRSDETRHLYAVCGEGLRQECGGVKRSARLCGT